MKWAPEVGIASGPDSDIVGEALTVVAERMLLIMVRESWPGLSCWIDLSSMTPVDAPGPVPPPLPRTRNISFGFFGVFWVFFCFCQFSGSQKKKRSEWQKEQNKKRAIYKARNEGQLKQNKKRGTKKETETTGNDCPKVDIKKKQQTSDNKEHWTMKNHGLSNSISREVGPYGSYNRLHEWAAMSTGLQAPMAPTTALTASPLRYCPLPMNSSNQEASTLQDLDYSTLFSWPPEVVGSLQEAGHVQLARSSAQASPSQFWQYGWFDPPDKGTSALYRNDKRDAYWKKYNKKGKERKKRRERKGPLCAYL